jgi:putative RNA 2'-phosphotransferase
MNAKQRVSVSKFLSLVLRHDPSAIGIRLDPAGWVDVSALLEAMAKAKKPLTMSDLIEVVETNEKKRFAFSDDRSRIRASQGHSVEVELGYEPVTPPSILYHGTADRNIESIRLQGLIKMNRQHVHLSSEEETAKLVGQRYGRSVVLIVETEKMATEGHVFFLSANGVWLTDHVPPSFLIFP